MTTPTIEAITNLLFIETSIERVDLVFVFGNDWTETMDHVHQLYQRGLAPKIIVSGHSANKDRSDSEAVRFMKRGVELGIPNDIIILEEQSTNTRDNFVFTLPIIEEKIGWSNIKKILFVCKTFHTRRVLMTANKYFPKDIEYLFLPMLDERNIRRDNWWKEQVSLDRVLAEVKRIGEYALKGDISIF